MTFVIDGVHIDLLLDEHLDQLKRIVLDSVMESIVAEVVLL